MANGDPPDLSSGSGRYDDFNPWDPGTFEHLWYQQGLAARAQPGRNIMEQRARKDEIPTGYTGLPFVPTHTPSIEDQRGMSLPELNLQAKYLQSKGVYGGYALHPGEEVGSYHPADLPTPTASVDPMSIGLGGRDLDKAMVLQRLLSRVGQKKEEYKEHKEPPLPRK